MKHELYISIEDGKIISGKTLIAKLLNSLHAGRYVMTIEKVKRKRTNNQNKYFHGCMIPMIQDRLIDLGFSEARSIEWVKDFVKYNCLVKEYVSEVTGEVIKSLGKTSELSTTEFNDLIADVQRFCAENMDLVIPDPNSQIALSV